MSAQAPTEEVVAPHESGDPIAVPSRDDPVIAGSCEVVGGPVGTRAILATGFWTPLRVVIAFGVVGFIAAYLTKMPCMNSGWMEPGRYTHMCYTDIAPLFTGRGLSDGLFPYISTPGAGQQYLEYPVLTGLFMWIAAVISPGGNGVSLTYFNINVIMLSVCFLALIAATALTVKRRPWDAAMVALAPAGLVSATINWDLLAVCLLAIAMLFWSRSRIAWAGVFIGLAAAAKFYPFLILFALLLLCIRTGKIRAFLVTFAWAIGTWLVVNIPFMVLNFHGWSTFYTFSSTRGSDFGSIWLLLRNVGIDVETGTVNLISEGLMAVAALALAAIALRARVRPRFAQLAFLIVAAFILTNKVYSPQYVLWLIPLAVLARPRWRDFLIWQAGECVYYAAIWLYLAEHNGKGLPQGWYNVAIVIHVAFTAWFAAMVIRDIFRPQCDPVRTDGQPDDIDDPGGGIFDKAANWTKLKWLPPAPGNN